VVHVMWWLGAETADTELVNSALVFTLTALLSLHVALITEIIRKEFSFYHTCIAMQFITLYTVLFVVHFPIGSGQARYTVKARFGFSPLLGLEFGELFYATSATASAIDVAWGCSTADLKISGFLLVYHDWAVIFYMLLIF